MYLIKNVNTDPYFNLALDEYLLTRCEGEFFTLWRNDKAVIIGRNQDALAEVNIDFLREHGISLVRRMSGGGAVFHDLGNVNFSYVTKCEKRDFFNFARFAAPIMSALGALGVNAQTTGRNDITIDGKKFSGNAQHLHHGRILHHGTLLYSSDLSYMQGALNVNPAKLAGKGVSSVKSRVTNIASHLENAPTTAQFIDFMQQHMLQFFPDIELYELSAKQISEVSALADEKYRQDAWNFLHMPNYSITNTAHGACGTVTVSLDIKNAVIQSAVFCGDFFGVLDISELAEKFVGIPHNRNDINAIIENCSLSDYISGCNTDSLLKLFF